MKPRLFLGLLLVVAAFWGLLLGLDLQGEPDAFFVNLVLNGISIFTVRAWAKAHSRKYQNELTPSWLWLLTFMSGVAVPLYLFKVHGFWRGCWSNIKMLMFLVLFIAVMVSTFLGGIISITANGGDWQVWL